MSGHRTFAHLAPDLLASPAIAAHPRLFGRWAIELGPTTADSVASTCVNAEEARRIADAWSALADKLRERDHISRDLVRQIGTGGIIRPAATGEPDGDELVISLDADRDGRELARRVLEQINREG